ncbi:MAG: hypothetical protein JXR60_09335 [Bacteroidales bacterium]|nr:hypothetical protein [Bacteroidales bacterium]
MKKGVQLTTKRKALDINLTSDIYGTLAEIGGGQEVARAFFQAGGASGTIAKSISAYDKTFSDHLYNNNEPGRYVSEERLHLMLDQEFNQLVQILDKEKYENTRYFVFADTVETLNYSKTNQGHGWLGVKFQLHPNQEANYVIIHVNLKENDQLLQQYTLGTLGVNLIYACFNYTENADRFILSLLDNLDTDRADINMVKMQGQNLEHIDNRLLSVKLVKNCMTNATMFDKNGDVKQPADMLYKKNVLAFRGSFRPITYAGLDMLKTSFELFRRDRMYDPENTLSMCEITVNNLLYEGDFDEKDFLDRVDLLNAVGLNVMISNFREYYRLSQYFSQFKIQKLRIVMGVSTIFNIFNKDYYSSMKGGIMEAFGKLFYNNLKLYIYPALKDDGELLTTENIEIPKGLKYLYKHLTCNRMIVDVPNADKDTMKIYSRKVFELINNNDSMWESMVPDFVAKIIKERELFGYKKQ